MTTPESRADSFHKKFAAYGRRMQALQFPLRALADEATAAYEDLRPKAEPVARVPREHPLRYVQAYDFAVAEGAEPSPDLVAVDTLLVRMTEDVDLIIDKAVTLPKRRGFHWRFVRSEYTAPLVSEQVTVQELPRGLHSCDGNLDIEAMSYAYPEQRGYNGRCTGMLLGFPDMEGAEARIEAFRADVKAAIDQFGG